jgi:hypothetical protein
VHPSDPYRARYDKLSVGDQWTKIAQIFGSPTLSEDTADGGTVYKYELAGCSLVFSVGTDDKLASKKASPPFGASATSEADSAGVVWLREKRKATQAYLEDLQHNAMNWNDSTMCRQELLTYEKAVSEALKWVNDQDKASQVVFDNADEEGNFKIAVPHPGIYTLLVRGRAGFNEAFWQDDVKVNSGVETTIKLSAPTKSCLLIE